MFIGSAIPDMNGFAIAQLPHDVAGQLLHDLLIQGEQEFEYERKIVQHPSNPLLHKYLYKKNFGTDHEDIDSYKVKGSDKLSGAAEKMDAASASSSLARTQGPRSQGPRFEVKALLVPIRKAKQQFEKQLSEAKDLLTELQIKTILMQESRRSVSIITKPVANLVKSS